jgi:hypothetical protein
MNMLRPDLMRLAPSDLSALASLRDVVLAKAINAIPEVGEGVVVFESPQAFLDISFRVGQGAPRVLIEYGRIGNMRRVVMGFFDAIWRISERDFGGIQAIVVDGNPGTASDFEEALVPFMTLPFACSEVNGDIS